MAREQWKLLLEPFAHSIAGMMDNIAQMSDDDLIELRDACTKPTQTNCWCYTYRAAALIRDEIDIQIRARGLTPQGKSAEDAK